VSGVRKSPFISVRPVLGSLGPFLSLLGPSVLTLKKDPKGAQKGPKVPKGVQQRWMTITWPVTPADKSYVQNAETFQKGMSFQKGPKGAKKGPKGAKIGTGGTNKAKYCPREPNSV